MGGQDEAAEMIDDGGPAFPHGPLGGSFTGPDGYTTHQYNPSAGMTLRAWLTGQALAGIDHGEHDAKYAAKWAIAVADEVIKQLKEAKPCTKA